MRLETVFGAAFAGSVMVNLLLFNAWVDAKSDVKAEIERCNTEKLQAVAEAREATMIAERDAYAELVAELEAIAADEARARAIAEEAARAAQDRPERVRTIIREVADENACMDTRIPDAVVRSLRD